MGLKSDQWIRNMASMQSMIEHFIDPQIREGIISYVESSN